MTTLFLITQIIIAVILTIAVLLQKSSSIGLGVYSGSNESLFGAKGPAGFMAKFTMALGLIFIINTIALGYFYTKQTESSIVDTTKLSTPAADSAPKSIIPSVDSSAFDNNPFAVNPAPSAPITTDSALDSTPSAPDNATCEDGKC